MLASTVTILNKLQSVRAGGEDKFTALCPAHDDRKNRSLSVGEKDGKTVLHCFTGCRTERIVEAIGLTMADLFNDDKYQAGRRTPYEIKNRVGKPIATHTRVEQADGKSYEWEREGKPNLGGVPVEQLPLYGVDRLGASLYAIVCEGEGPAQSLIDRGYPAVGTVTGAGGTPSRDVLRALITPLPGGGHLVRAALAVRAKFIEPKDAEEYLPLQQRAVYLWPDNDPPGKAHMGRIAERLVQLGEWPLMIQVDLKPKGDAADFKGDVDELLGSAVPWEGVDLSEPEPEFKGW